MKYLFFFLFKSINYDIIMVFNKIIIKKHKYNKKINNINDFQYTG